MGHHGVRLNRGSGRLGGILVCGQAQGVFPDGVDVALLKRDDELDDSSAESVVTPERTAEHQQLIRELLGGEEPTRRRPWGRRGI